MALLVMGGLGVFLILMGLFLYRRRTRDHAKAVAALTWPRARARITASTVGVTKEISGNPDDLTPNTFYVPQISFAYEVGGTAYQGSRVSYADLKTAFRKKVDERVAKYPVGAVVEVAYDPAQPSESVLETGTKGTSAFNFNNVFLFAAGIASILAGIFIQIYGPK